VAGADSASSENSEPHYDVPDALHADVPPGDKRIGREELVVGNISENESFQKVGLKEGDIIRVWNGKKVSKNNDWEFIKSSMNTSKKFKVVIERDGQEKILHYNKE
jgi:S1-C subfamily serine protease